MNILVDSLALLGVFAPAAGVAMAAARRRHRQLLQKGITLKNHGRYFLSERTLSDAGKPVMMLGLTDKHPVLIEAQTQLCWLWIQENKFEYAAKTLQTLRTLTENKPGFESLSVGVQDASAWLQLQAGNRREALPLLERGLQTCRDNPDVFGRSLVFASILCTRGWYHMLENNPLAAGTYLRQSQAALMGAVGAQSIHHLPVLMNMAWLDALAGETRDANQMLAHALRTYAPVLGKWHPRNAHVLALLGGVAGLDGDWRSAAEYLRVSAKILRAHGLTHTLQGQKVETALNFINRL
jgi:hypothetical protein